MYVGSQYEVCNYISTGYYICEIDQHVIIDRLQI